MRILVTGAKGFVGKNLCWALKNIQAGKDRTHPSLFIDAVYEYDLDSTPEQLDVWCKECNFVFNLAGVNRPKDKAEFMTGNYPFRRLWPGGLALPNMAGVRRLANNCFLIIAKKLVQRC